MSARYAYADPIYPGCEKLYEAEAAAAGREVVGVNHRVLIGSLCELYPDGWALSTSSVALASVLPLCPPDVRVCAWLKSFASFKPNVNPGYCWEPLILRGGRSHRDRSEPTVRDFVVCPIALKKGVPGAKPPKFSHWVLDLLGAVPGDTVDDLFPGSGAVGEAIDGYFGRVPMHTGSLFEVPA